MHSSGSYGRRLLAFQHAHGFQHSFNVAGDRPRIPALDREISAGTTAPSGGGGCGSTGSAGIGRR